mmetsp:Transcript_15826/g.35482  ORF Transcript_15826/g.35482 Transcript_15826/m.35482 type:complete len:93 (-) Transcript_15826:479-757(-)
MMDECWIRQTDSPIWFSFILLHTTVLVYKQCATSLFEFTRAATIPSQISAAALPRQFIKKTPYILSDSYIDAAYSACFDAAFLIAFKSKRDA